MPNSEEINRRYDTDYLDHIGMAPDYAELIHLLDEKKYTLKSLYILVNRRANEYKKISIPKKSGGYRVLHIPSAPLKALQRTIDRKITAHFPVSSYAAAYHKGADLLDNGKAHAGKPMVFCLDIRNFFGSITQQQVYFLFRGNHRFSPRTAMLLAALCCYNGSLPQGAPASPAIANAYLRDFDNTLGAWCAAQQITYTRYCDDLVFSGSFAPDKVRRKTESLLFPLGLSLNRQKTRLFCKGQRQKVTGLVVNQKVTVPKEYRRKIRQEMYYCTKYGVDQHMQNIGLHETRDVYLNRLLGKVSFVLHIMPYQPAFTAYKKQIIAWCRQ